MKCAEVLQGYVTKLLTRKAPNTTKAEFANTVDPDELSHPDLQCLPSGLT